MNNKIFQENARVIYTREIAENTFETMLYSPQISKYAKPGQFINILPSNNWNYMMRRPMSIASQEKNVLYSDTRFSGSVADSLLLFCVFKLSRIKTWHYDCLT